MTAQAFLSSVDRVYSLSGEAEIIPTSGNQLLDRALTRALATLSRDFEVIPAFAYYDDRNDGAGGNARAIPAVHSGLHRADGTVLDGTVLFGKNLLRHCLARPQYPDAAIVAIAAHEFGHILQFKRGIALRMGGNTTMIELHADFLSGYFAGLRKLRTPDYPAAVFGAVAASLGGGDHGTPHQRGSAVEAGFLAAARDKLALSQAVEQGIRHVRRG
ncbi:MAG: metalloprotease [Reyranella sp.]|uniref:metalloprotease n=1 Tax=Reyranella sp. TaxID=1929291 RepID=UPI00121D664E|nr:metalloprotease [Reyranella sp.]TAJ42781.1 MAG: metalloprotease [Reyranella sp.]